MTEPKVVRVPSPGDGRYWEQIDRGSGPEYVFYRPANELQPTEGIDYDGFNAVQDDDTTIHYKPMKTPLWLLPGEPLEYDDDLWDEVKDFIYAHVDFPDPRLYDVKTAWVFMTWMPELFNTSPYFKYGGVKNVGKTRALEVDQHLCRRAVLCASVSEAALFRLIESYGVVYLLDETEVYGVEARQVVQNVLNSGYRRGQVIPRCETAENGSIIIVGYSPYGPKALAGTNFLKDTLESRCINVVMSRNRRPINFNIDQAWSRKLRSKLLLWRFRRLHDLDQVYGAPSAPGVPSDGYIEAPPELGSLVKDSRVLEIFSPLITLADTDEVKQIIISYAVDTYNENQEEESTGAEATVLAAVIECSNHLDSGKFSTRQVAELFNLDKPDNEKWKTQSVGRVVKALGFKPKRLSGGVKGYLYDAGLVTRLSDRYQPPLIEPSLEAHGTLEALTNLDDYAEFDARRQQRFNDMTKEAIQVE